MKMATRYHWTLQVPPKKWLPPWFRSTWRSAADQEHRDVSGRYEIHFRNFSTMIFSEKCFPIRLPNGIPGEGRLLRWREGKVPESSSMAMDISSPITT